MPRPVIFFVAAILIVPLATVLATGQRSVAEPAVDECKTAPGSSAPRAATGTTASNAQISGTVGSWGPKVHKCDRKHAKCRPARHHQRARPSAKMLVEWLPQHL